MNILDLKMTQQTINALMMTKGVKGEKCQNFWRISKVRCKECDIF